MFSWENSCIAKRYYFLTYYVLFITNLSVYVIKFWKNARENTAANPVEYCLFIFIWAKVIDINCDILWEMSVLGQNCTDSVFFKKMMVDCKPGWRLHEYSN